MQQQANYRFINWAKNESCVAKNFYQPETEEEIIDLVTASAKVRVVGSGHSWNSICHSEEVLLNFDRYNKVLHLDKEKLQVKLQPGMKLWQLNEYLDKEGLALANLGSISDQSVAGAISTGTHGTGIKYQILGSQVEEFSLIKASGGKIRVHRERDKDLFNLSIVNLGCLGIISDITINVVPAFRLQDMTISADFDKTIDVLERFIDYTDHFKMWWFPHTKEIVLYRYSRTQQAANDSRFRQWFMDEFVSVNLYRLLLKLGTIKRPWRKAINNLLVKNFRRPLHRIEKSYKVFNVPEPPLHRETEWGFDVSQAKDLLREYKQMIEHSQHRMNFIQEIRFTKADDFALSPCYGRDTIWLGAYNADNFGWNELLKDFEILARKYNGRPHWGKEFTRDKDYLQSAYPKFEAFNSLRKEFDPDGKFENDYIRKIFS
jgi:L-gulonolactone oxidase